MTFFRHGTAAGSGCLSIVSRQVLRLFWTLALTVLLVDALRRAGMPLPRSLGRRWKMLTTAFMARMTVDPLGSCI